ncbi:MAG: hypothetical protein ACYDCJ_12915 [Gammaproteobacteria bacterium]
MNQQQAKLTIAFLNRVQLQGQEVPAFIQVMLELERLAADKPVSPPVQTEPMQ